MITLLWKFIFEKNNKKKTEEIIAKGLDIKHVKNLLRDQGILETDKDRGRFDKNVKINGKTKRMYVINNKIFGEDEDDETFYKFGTIIYTGGV